MNRLKDRLGEKPWKPCAFAAIQCVDVVKAHVKHTFAYRISTHRWSYYCLQLTNLFDHAVIYRNVHKRSYVFERRSRVFISPDLMWPTRRWAHNRNNPVTISNEPQYCEIIYVRLQTARRLNRMWIINSAPLARFFSYIRVFMSRRHVSELAIYPLFLPPREKKRKNI